ncbi:MAG: hypothetical protein Q4D05_06760 [Acinetobacter sp.]|nr:hypothetical protein [Acinetobacter sp.]
MFSLYNFTRKQPLSTLMSTMLMCGFLVACGGQQNKQNSEQTAQANSPATKQATHEQPAQKIQPAAKLSPDATAHAQRAWVFINQAEQLVEQQQKDVLDLQVRQPIRQLTQDWMTQVKMNDAVTEGKYAMCRKSLTSLDIWARAVLEQSSDIEKKKAAYQRDKALCQDAIEHPDLGNTDPKMWEKSSS